MFRNTNRGVELCFVFYLKSLHSSERDIFMSDELPNLGKIYHTITMIGCVIPTNLFSLEQKHNRNILEKTLNHQLTSTLDEN